MPAAADADATPDATRAKVRARFEAALGADAGAALEAALWRWTIRTCERDRIPLFWQVGKKRGRGVVRSLSRARYRYTTKALSLAYNLTVPGNPGLRRRVVDGDLDLARLLDMRPAEMWPERWKDVEERVRFRQLRREAATLDPATMPDGAYTCSKCRTRKTVYTELQTRAADEPTTKFVRCLNCGKAWKD